MSTPPDQALEALAHAVATAKGDAPLRPVTIIVPTNASGVMVRRSLARGRGVAAIDIVTVSRLAERLAGPVMAEHGRVPVSSPLIELVVRSVLRQQPGSFGAVATHPSTIKAVRELYQQVRLAGARTLDALGATTASLRSREAARVVTSVNEALLTTWYDEGDLLATARGVVEREGVDWAVAAVAFLPQSLTGLAAALVAAVAKQLPTTMVVASTGVEAVDADTAHTVTLLGGTVPDTPVASPRVAPTIVVSTTDADDEVRHAVRAIVDAARDGVAFARMAILWPADEPYARLVQHHLDAANITWNGRPGTQVSERLVPRFLVDLLDLDRHDLRRADLFNLLADVPLMARDGTPVPVARWERIARRAGVQRGDQWGPRLATYAESERAAADSADSEARAKMHERNAGDAERLANFVSALQRDLSQRPRSWSEWAEWCEQQLDQRLGRSTLEGLIEADRLAFEHTNRVLDRLRTLDALGQAPTDSPADSPANSRGDSPGGRVGRNEFRAVFAAEFEAAPGRLGRLGDGVTVGSITGTIPLDTDLTIVLGAIEGLLPPPPIADPLLSDHDRERAGLPTSERRAIRAHLGFITALATAGKVMVGVPRGDLRASTERIPSRWLADHLPSVVPTIFDSHHHGLRSVPFPSGDTEFRLRRALLATQLPIDQRPAAVSALATSTHDEVLARGLNLRTARRMDSITEFDGDLSRLELAHFQRPVSASQLEAWVKCPHAYFMRYLLGVYPIDESVDALSVSPMDMGNVLHHTIDRFNQLVLSDALPQPGQGGWTPAHYRALFDIFDEVADEYERLGRTGKPASWELERPNARAELAAWFRKDSDTFAARVAEVVASEHQFGLDGDVRLPLPDGDSIAVHGFVDRIDRGADGRLYVVDHKTGSDRDFGGLGNDDPTANGTKLQLPTYAAAALALIGRMTPDDPTATPTSVTAEYAFFGRSKPAYDRKGYTLRDDTWEKVSHGLARAVGGIRSGLYPAVTDPPKYEFYVKCEYCQPDKLGTAERYGEWSRKQFDPRIRPFFGTDDGSDESESSTDPPTPDGSAQDGASA